MAIQPAATIQPHSTSERRPIDVFIGITAASPRTTRRAAAMAAAVARSCQAFSCLVSSPTSGLTILAGADIAVAGVTGVDTASLATCTTACQSLRSGVITSSSVFFAL